MHHMAKAAVDALFAALTDADACSHLLSSTQLLQDQKGRPFDAFLKGPASADQDELLTMQLTFAACLAMLYTAVTNHTPC